jgi:hypothetical protein
VITILFKLHNDTPQNALSLRSYIDNSLSGANDNCLEHTPGRNYSISGDENRVFPSVVRRKGIYHIDLLDEKLDAFTIADILETLLLRLRDLDNNFLFQLSLKPTRSRRVVAQEPQQVYIDSPRLAPHARKICEGWWMDTNISWQQLKGRLRIICDVAGLIYGTDLILRN